MENIEIEFIVFERICDGLISLAYFAIPTFMLIFGYRKKIKSNIIIWLFILFITSCGITHAINVFNRTQTTIYMMGAAKFITAIVSLITAAAMIKELPRLAFIEQHLSTLERNQLDMSNYIFHEIRIPFHSIKLCIADLKRSTNLTGTQHEIIDIMANSVDHSSTILNDLLDLAKITKGHFLINKEAVLLEHLINPVIKPFQEVASSQDIDLKIINNLPKGTKVTCDSTRITQCLNNFLSNAFKFTPHHRAISLTITSKENELSFTVSDQGCGIPEDQIGKLFSPFVNISTGKSSEVGTGLGLTISKQIAILHGGDIQVQSMVNKGSDFTLKILSDIQYPSDDVVIQISENDNSDSGTINVVDAVDASLASVASMASESDAMDADEDEDEDKDEDADADADASAEFAPSRSERRHSSIFEQHENDMLEEGGNGSCRVLIVDDNRNNRFLLSRHLKFSEIDSDLAKNGQDAIDHLAKNPHYKIIFMDKNMPVMDGEEAISQIREKGLKIPIVVLSGITSSVDQERLVSIGANHILTKPIDFKEFDKILKKYL